MEKNQKITEIKKLVEEIQKLSGKKVMFKEEESSPYVQSHVNLFYHKIRETIENIRDEIGEQNSIPSVRRALRLLEKTYNSKLYKK